MSLKSDSEPNNNVTMEEEVRDLPEAVLGLQKFVSFHGNFFFFCLELTFFTVKVCNVYSKTRGK